MPFLQSFRVAGRRAERLDDAQIQRGDAYGIVEDGVVKTLNIEESPGQATVSGAAAMIEQL